MYFLKQGTRASSEDPRGHMQANQICPPILALAGAALLLGPAETRSFDVYGDVLDLTQRDFRILNGFSGPFANSNQVPDPDFPGSLGAELAIRKGIAEWGSRPHGSGLTDPSQGTLGSGGSNFDAFFAGRSDAAGGPNRNIISVIAGSGGAFAFTELPIGDGWRIRFYNNVRDWNDRVAPPLLGSNPLDIQGVMTHEFGHALGLDHSAVPGATMDQVTSDRGVDLRSIERDDQDGVQFLYGLADPLKPRLDTYRFVQGGSVLRIEGEHFDAMGNEIWFTPDAPTHPMADPIVRIPGTPSIDGGTAIELTVPPGVGPGDLAIKLSGSGSRDLSNVLPFDPTREPWTPPAPYGAPGVSASGTDVILDWESLPSATAGSMSLSVRGGDTAGIANGLIAVGTSRGRALTPFGTLHITGALRRAAVVTTLDGAGTVSLNLSPTPLMGTCIFVQAWLPDGGPSGGVFSNALKIQVTQ